MNFSCIFLVIKLVASVLASTSTSGAVPALLIDALPCRYNLSGLMCPSSLM